jgi:hypothetical protein
MYASYVSPFLICHLTLTFAAEKPPSAHVFEQIAIMAADGGGSLARAGAEEPIGRSVFELIKVETFLSDHKVHILRAKK